MNYQGYLIANSETGLDRERQPWLLPDDAQYELLDGFVYRGVWQNRDGYSQFATGQRGGAPYCESRMVNRITDENIGSGDGSELIFDATLSNVPIRRGTVTIEYTISANSETATDNGLGAFTGPFIDSDLSTIDYTTGQIHLVFTTAPDNSTAITVTYDQHQGYPVMGVMNFYTQQNTRELIVADTTYVNRYNTATNRLDDISPSVLLTGNKSNFMSWTNYPDPANLQRLLFVNFKDPIQQYNGSTVTPYPVYTSSVQVTNTPSGVLGDGTVGPYNITTPANTGIVPGTLSVIDVTGTQTINFDQFGVASGAGSGTVNFLTGEINVTFNVAVGVGNDINITYKQLNTPIDTALHIFQFKDRLVVAYTIEAGIQYGLRLRISGTGAMGDVFTRDAIGAGVIDIPTSTFICSGDFNRDDLLLFVQQESWALKYSGNDTIPFVLDRIDGSRGSEAPYGTITYLNRTNTLSPYGMVITDGYSLERSDDKLPEFSFNEIDSSNFRLCFAGSVDKDRDHYLIYPSTGQDQSDRILVTNYEEDNFSIYRIPLSCMGNFIVSEGVNWNDLLIYDTWQEMADVYRNWNSFTSRGYPISIGGGHEGQIVKLNDTGTEDYPVKIRDITILDSQTIQVTTDFQKWRDGDFIAIEAVQGMVEVNNKQYELISVISDYQFTLRVPSNADASTFSSYLNGGTASKCIVFESKTKKFNPFVNEDKKVSCGWLYFYVSTTGTALTVNKLIQDALQTNPCILTVPGHGYKNGTQVYVDGVQGMTELNEKYYFINVIDENTIELEGVDASGFTPYSSGGFTSTPQEAILQVRCISNDTEQSTQVYPYNPAPYQVNLSSHVSENGIKKWYKLWINQTARFIQFQVINNQSGAIVQIHAIMPGFAPVGRMI